MSARSTVRDEVIRLLAVAPELAGPAARQAGAVPFADLVAVTDTVLTALEALGVDLEVAVGERAATWVLADGRTFVAGVGILEDELRR